MADPPNRAPQAPRPVISLRRLVMAMSFIGSQLPGTGRPPAVHCWSLFAASALEVTRQSKPIAQEPRLEWDHYDPVHPSLGSLPALPAVPDKTRSFWKALCSVMAIKRAIYSPSDARGPLRQQPKSVPDHVAPEAKPPRIAPRRSGS